MTPDCGVNNSASTFSCADLEQVLFNQLDLQSDASLAIAYSGGCDSTVLLYALAQLRRQFPLKLTALHFNHGLQPAADQWQADCLGYCRQLNIPFKSVQAKLSKQAGSSLEASARSARYDWFESVLATEDILLTAHHADDQAETVLLRLMRASGVEGLSGIPVRRSVGSANDSPQVMRPLLDFKRSALEQYAVRHELPWIEDNSNLDSVFDRNFLRHEVMPLLHQRWPAVVDSLNRSARHAAASARLLAQLAQDDIKACKSSVQPSLFCLSQPLNLDSLLKLDRDRVTNLLRHWMRGHGLQVIPQKRLETWFDQVFNNVDCENSVIQWPGAELRCFRRAVYLCTPVPTQRHQDVHWTGHAMGIPDCALTVSVQQQIGWAIDPDVAASGCLWWRWRRGGERCRLPGREHSSSLKKLFQEGQVPPWQRDACPYLTDGERVVWLYDIGICDVDGVTSEQGGIVPQIISATN